MDFNVEKYKNSIDYIHQMMSDIIASIQEGSTTSSKYVIIPTSKKGKNFIKFYISNLATKDSALIFISPQTIGVKIYDDQNAYQYDYSISAKDNKQVVQINFADGTGLKKIYTFNTQTNRYDLIETVETIQAKDIINLDDYSDPIINEDLLIYNMYKKMNDQSLIGFVVSYGDRKSRNHNYNNNMYSLDQHPELSRINDFLRKSQVQFANSYVATSGVLHPEQFSHDIVTFRQSFKSFIQSMDQSQGNIHTSDTGPDTDNR